MDKEDIEKLENGCYVLSYKGGEHKCFYMENGVPMSVLSDTKISFEDLNLKNVTSIVKNTKMSI
jgi:hypothetical protein